MAERIGLLGQITIGVLVTRDVVERVGHRGDAGRQRCCRCKLVMLLSASFSRQQIAGRIVSVGGDVTERIGRGQGLAERVVSELSYVAERIGDAGAMIVGVVGVGCGLAERVGFRQTLSLVIVSERGHAAARVGLASEHCRARHTGRWSDGPGDL